MEENAMFDWKIVAEAANEAEAYIIVGRLAQDDIKAWVQQEPAGSAIGITVGALGEVNVMVSAEDYERAKALLAQDQSDVITDEDVIGAEIEE
jgi:hypothetical protein